MKVLNLIEGGGDNLSRMVFPLESCYKKQHDEQDPEDTEGSVGAKLC